MYLNLGCQWKERPIKTDSNGLPEIHFITVYRAFRQRSANGCFDRIFLESVSMVVRGNQLDICIIHGDGTSTITKKGGDNLIVSGHKHFQGDKVVAFCDRNCNVIAPFVSAEENRNKSPLLRDALSKVKQTAKAVGFELKGSIVSLDGVFDGKKNRKVIFNSGMTPNINPILKCLKRQNRNWRSARTRE